MNLVFIVVKYAILFVSLMFLTAMPFVGYPLGHTLHTVRRKVDDRINWENTILEDIEDIFTHTSVVVVAFLFYILAGNFHVWLYLTKYVPVFNGLKSLDTFVIPLVYWTVFYWVALVFGWRKGSKSGDE